jgi:TonB family protein
MIPMARHNPRLFRSQHRPAAVAFTYLAAGILAIVATLPLRASDERPIKQRVAPTYPELARRMHVSGVVRVAATVAPDGSVTATKTMSGNHMLSLAAEEAVHKWKFVPAPDQSVVEIEINFAPAP